MGCGEKVAKLLMFAFNFIFFLCGAALLAIGIWIVVDKSSLIQLVAKAGSDSVTNQLDAGSVVTYAAYILIAVGALAFLIGFCGCCGACKESVCLLRIYFFCIGLLLIFQIVGVILAAVFKDKIESTLMNGLINLQNQTYVGLPKSAGDDSVSLAFDLMNLGLDCCGVNGSIDFTQNYKDYAYKWYEEGRVQNGTNLKIPYSCCMMDNKDFMKEGKYTDIVQSLKNDTCGLEMVDYYKEGCYNKVKSIIEEYAVVIIAVAAVIILIEILGIVITCCLIRDIK